MGQIFVYINMPIVDTLFCLPQYINLLITRVSSLFAGKYYIYFAFVDVSRGFFLCVGSVGQRPELCLLNLNTLVKTFKSETALDTVNSLDCFTYGIPCKKGC